MLSLSTKENDIVTINRMFSKGLANKAILDSTFRNHTALGRKVASNITVSDMDQEAREPEQSDMKHDFSNR